MFSTKCFFKRKKIERMRDKFIKGQLLDRSDFEAIGIDGQYIARTIVILKQQYGLDILNVCRGKSLVGWILAEEIL